MKLIRLVFIFLIGVSYSSFAQDEIDVNDIMQGLENQQFLKEFKFELEPNSTGIFKLVLTKDKKYGAIHFFHKKNYKVELMQRGKKEIILPSHIDLVKKVINNKEIVIVSSSYDIKKSINYDLVVTNNTNKKISSKVLLTSIKDDKSFNANEEIVKITANKKVKSKEESQVFFVVENMPEFKTEKYNQGGTASFNAFIKDNLKYPLEAKKEGVYGKVYVSMVVTYEGYLKDITVIRGLHPALDQEALRVVSSSPKWIPGTQNGQAVNVSYTFPVVFKK